MPFFGYVTLQETSDVSCRVGVVRWDYSHSPTSLLEYIYIPMLKKNQRLRTASFNEVFRLGQRLHAAHFQVIYLKSADFHASVVVGKKVHKTAVARNRLRRQVYGALYRAAKAAPLPYTLIVVAKPSLKTVSAKGVSPLVAEVVALLRAR